MDRAGVPYAMRTDPLCRERWQGLARLCDGATNEVIDPETRQRLMESIEEDKILGATLGHERF